MQAGEIGVVVTIDPQLPTSGTFSTLVGAALTLWVTHPDNSRHSIAVAIAAGDATNRTAQFTCSATDFPVGGTYTLQLVAAYDATHKFKSPETPYVVGASLV